MIKRIIYIAVLSSIYFVGFANNPFRTQFADAPLWTDSLNWQNTVTITNFIDTGETTTDSALIRAFRQLGELGGTVFFPAGDYYFSENISLPSGVILRGENPLNDDARLNNFAPPSRFIFPKYIPLLEGSGTPNSTAFKAIYTPSTSKNCALVFLDINRGRITLGNSYSERMLVFGVRQNNIAQPDASIPDLSFMNAWQRFSYRHTRNISVYAKRAAAIVNCRVNDLQNNTLHPIEDDSYDQPGYIINGSFVAKKGADPSTAEDNPGSISSTGQTTMKYGNRIKFNYLDHYGIAISGARMNPAINPRPINQEILLQNNWVLTTMRVGYFIEGIGAIARGNVRRDIAVKIGWIHATGKSLNSNNAATFENRSLNFAGENILIENNDFEVERHTFVSGYKSIDGEGILIQWQDPWGFDTNNPSSGFNARMYDITIRNNKVNSYIGIYDIQIPISNFRITGNDLQGKGSILVFKKERTHRIDNLIIEDNKNITGIAVGNKIGTEYGMPGSNIFIRNNLFASGSLSFPYQSVVSGNINPSSQSVFTTDQIIPIIQQPYHGAYTVSDTSTIKLEFSQPIETLNLSGVYLLSHDTQTKKFLNASVVNKTLLIDNKDGFALNSALYTLVVPKNTVKFANTTIQNDSIGWTFRTNSVENTTRIAQYKTTDITIFPNPATEIIRFNGFSNMQNIHVEVFDLNGILKISKVLNSNDELFVGELSKGFYIVKVDKHISKLMIN
jgi:hypothetical protein